MPSYSPDALRRWPDVESAELFAIDAADRLLLDESAAARADAPEGSLVIVGDSYGALTLGAADAGATGIRVHQDLLSAERALSANADRAGLAGAFRSLPFGSELLTGARVVLVRLPRALDALDDIAALIAAHADPEVVVFAGGRIKHMTVAMNEVLRRSFGSVDVTHARQKSRVLIARRPLPASDPQPRTRAHAVPGLDEPLTVCAFGGAFAGTSIDIGTRFLLEHLGTPSPVARGDIIDFGCGTGVIAAWLALCNPEATVLATDQSAVAVASASATAAANGIADRVTVVRDLGLASRPDASASFIALNPPFHTGTAVPDGVAEPMFAEAGRVLQPGGELWTVWNSPLQYRGALERLVGRTRQVARNKKFTVTVSTRG
ncbi:MULTISPECIES: methyltransferase [unclassified Microbacterium]|uniref:class I SAM-dependent methyltransferase n=1 Tax=unclassified Microbacterium TaxID=2609290 RepID=UPI00214AB252|nr:MULTISPECIES: methyltransferase [unclassified Microbacterium]MCR2809620.1 methyltransferase [Microbacterium sp. zg.B185]WIM18055.1 methyltransferase [Microbacterium sp. zg-B185]